MTSFLQGSWERTEGEASGVGGLGCSSARGEQGKAAVGVQVGGGCCGGLSSGHTSGGTGTGCVEDSVGFSWEAVGTLAGLPW